MVSRLVGATFLIITGVALRLAERASLHDISMEMFVGAIFVIVTLELALHMAIFRHG